MTAASRAALTPDSTLEGRGWGRGGAARGGEIDMECRRSAAESTLNQGPFLFDVPSLFDVPASKKAT